MNQLEEFDFTTPTLLVFCLGGQAENCNIETHDVVFVVAKTTEEAARKIRDKWFGTPESVHVDSWFKVDYVDGFEVQIEESQIETSKRKISLYFVNLGYYHKALIGEYHYMTLVAAKSKSEAIKTALSRSPSEVEMTHVDDLHELEGCIKIGEVDDYWIRLKYRGVECGLSQPINGYQNIPKAKMLS